MNRGRRGGGRWRGRGGGRGGQRWRGRGRGRGRGGKRGWKKKKRRLDHTVMSKAVMAFLKEHDVKFVDTHVHFNLIFQRLVPRKDQMSERKIRPLKDLLFSKKESVQKELVSRFEFVLTVFCDPISLSPSLSLYDELTADDDLQIYCSFGLHPHEAKSWTDVIEKNLFKLIRHRKCVAFGEIGLDYHYNFSPREVQRKVFETQLKMAVKLDLPIIIHSRESEGDTLKILKALVKKDTHIHVHCYTSSDESFAKDLLAYFKNLYFGFTGILTYSSTKKTIQKLVREVLPLNRILLESDGPYIKVARDSKYLSGVVGGKDDPLDYDSHILNIPFVAMKVAELKKITVEEVLKQINENSRRMYKIEEIEKRNQK